MKYLLSLIVFSTLVCELHAQADSVNSSSQLKVAPDELKNLLSKIQQEQALETKKDAELEIDGLLFDNTRTKNGNEFYEYFFRDWIAPPKASNYSVFISEKPYRLSTTMIEIRINETIVFQSFLQPRSDAVEQLAQQAVSQTQLYLQNYEEIVRQLEGDDRSGSGIY